MAKPVGEIIDGLLEDAETALAAGTTHKALALYQGILLHDPDHVLALRQAGAIMFNQDMPGHALDLFQRAVQLAPADPDLYHGLATALRLIGQPDEAMLALQGALRVDPSHKPALYDLGLLHRLKGNFGQAEQLFRQAAAQAGGGDRFEAELQRAIALYRQDRLPEAERWFHRAGILNPHDPRAFINVALIYRTWGHLNAAEKWLNTAIEVAPDNAEAHWNLANLLLLKGELLRGFAEYEWRFRRPGRGERVMPMARWSGEALAGKAILLAAEQGIGDIIHFVRFARQFQALGARVIVECHAGLERLLATARGVDEVIALGAALPAADYYLPIMSAPHLLGTTLDTIPAVERYVSVPAGITKIPLAGSGLRVGLVWRGNAMHENDQFRSVALSVFAPILAVPGVSFFSLQVGAGREDLASLSGGAVTDLGGQLTDFSVTAGVVEQLDLVITVDTAVAHLAGALGKPTWLLAARGNDWRWLHGQSDSPWYPTLRVFRQAPPRDWAPTIRQIEVALRELAGTKTSAP
jgi:Flp pilus assembly protein TadD